MNNILNENQLIVHNIVDAMVDTTSIQPDIDETKLKAAALVAQRVDIQRIIGKPNLLRCIDATLAADIELYNLVVPALCYYTYSRLLKMFPGTFTDSGYIIDKEASDKNVTRMAASEYYSIAEVYMGDILEFLQIETPNDLKVKKENLTPRIRVFGGEENRGK
jgi:hypothetical protein